MRNPLEKPKVKTVDPQEVPEVLNYLEVAEEIEEFKERHKDVFSYFSALLEKRDAALEEAEKACRGSFMSCGPFECYQVSTRIDAKALLDALGDPDIFLKIGGAITTETKFDVDKKKLEGAVAKGLVPPAVLEEAVKHSPTFRMPKKSVMP